MAKMACAQCGGAKRMKAGGTTEDPVSKKTVRQGMRAERKMDRQDKRFMRKYEKQKAEELMKSKRFQTGGMTGIVGMPKYGNNPNTQEGRMLKNGGAFAPNRAVQASCKGGMVRDENGRCVMQRKMQMGGLAKKKQVGERGYLQGPLSKEMTGEIDKLKPIGPRDASYMKDYDRYKRSLEETDRVPAYYPKSSPAKGKKMQTGGTTKAKKFAALAPPYNKATAADRIAGAKKNARKK
jgi:hypothetical protein